MAKKKADAAADFQVSRVNLVANLRWLSILPWLQERSLDQVIEAWWLAQNQKADHADEMERRRLDPHNMHGKSRAYVAAYYAKEKEGKKEDED